MKRIKYIFMITFLVLGIGIISLSMMDKTYSYGVLAQVAGSEGNYKLEIFDADTEYQISCDDAFKYFGFSKYQRRSKNGKVIYFYNCKETTKENYELGKPREEADVRAKEKVMPESE